MSNPSDTVAPKSGFLCMYMSNHPDTLVAYVKHYGKVPGKVKSAKMTSIDQQAMTLSYELQNGTGGTTRVVFDPPLLGYEEVKPRLIAMTAEAQEALGMIKAPVLTSFKPPLAGMLRTTLTISGLVYILCPPLGTHPTFMPARMLQESIGFSLSYKAVLGFTAFLHGLEALYALSICRKSVRGFVPTTLYAVSTLIWGFPIWISLKKRIQAARIDSVMKTE